MMDACMYHEAEYALTKGRKPILLLPSTNEPPAKFRMCGKCETWHPDTYTECPFCFAK